MRRFVFCDCMWDSKTTAPDPFLWILAVRLNCQSTIKNSTMAIQNPSDTYLRMNSSTNDDAAIPQQQRQRQSLRFLLGLYGIFLTSACCHAYLVVRTPQLKTKVNTTWSRAAVFFKEHNYVEKKLAENASWFVAGWLFLCQSVYATVHVVYNKRRPFKKQ